MAQSPSILCEKCRAQEATVHLMRVVSRMRSAGGSEPPATPGDTAQPREVSEVNFCEACAIATGAIPRP